MFALWALFCALTAVLGLTVAVYYCHLAACAITDAKNSLVDYPDKNSWTVIPVSDGAPWWSEYAQQAHVPGDAKRA